MADALEIVCLWGKKRDSGPGKGDTPSSTDKGVRELRARGHRIHDIDVSAIQARLPAAMPAGLRTTLAFALGTARLVRLCRDPRRVVYTTNHPWIRTVARLKRAGAIRNRVVAVWTANDVDYAALAHDGAVRRHLRGIVRQLDACIVNSARERRLWCDALPACADRIAFWPTAVDVDFYRARAAGAPGAHRRRIVAVGSDNKRDWAVPLALAAAGVPVTILTADPRVPELVAAAGARDCELLFGIGMERSAAVLADAGAILLATLPNDRFSGSTTVGAAAALARPLLIDEPHDLAAYGLVDGANCAAFRRGDAADATRRARALLADPAAGDRLGSTLATLADALSLRAYVPRLEAALRPGWHASDMVWTPDA